MRFNVIAIAGLPGSGKSTLLSALKKLPEFAFWSDVSTGTLLRERHAELVKGDQFKGTFLDYLNTLTDDEVRILNNRARERVLQGNCILDSRYALENCKDVPNCLSIFLTAQLSTRIQRLKIKNPQKEESEIRDDLVNRERWEYERGLRIYSYDYRHQAPYGIVLDTSTLTLEQEIDAIFNRLGATPA